MNLYALFFIVFLICFDILLNFFFALIYFHDMVNRMDRSTTVGQYKSEISRSTQWWIHIIMRGKRFDENGVSMVQKRSLCQSDQSDQVIFTFFLKIKSSFFCPTMLLDSPYFGFCFCGKKMTTKKILPKNPIKSVFSAFYWWKSTFIPSFLALHQCTLCTYKTNQSIARLVCNSCYGKMKNIINLFFLFRYDHHLSIL